MAIQQIDLAVPNGDTVRSANVKINENFSNPDHAASKLVGKSPTQIALNGDVNEIAFKSTKGTGIASDQSITSLAEFPEGGTHYIGSTRFTDMPLSYQHTNLISFAGSANSRFQIFHGYQNYVATSIYMRSGRSPTAWVMLYHDKNTTKEEGTGYLVASSPVLKVQHDSFEKVHEAEQLDIEVKSIKTGVYEIAGTTGLREGDGWNLKPPKDVNGNVLCICEATEKNGVITLKTYKKKFDFETVSIVADYEQPTDIPEGATVMLRFNDIPQELLDEPIE